MSFWKESCRFGFLKLAWQASERERTFLLPVFFNIAACVVFISTIISSRLLFPAWRANNNGLTLAGDPQSRSRSKSNPDSDPKRALFCAAVQKLQLGMKNLSPEMELSERMNESRRRNVDERSRSAMKSGIKMKVNTKARVKMKMEAKMIMRTASREFAGANLDKTQL